MQEDFKTDTTNAKQIYPDYNLSEDLTKNLTAEPQQPSKGFDKLKALMKIVNKPNANQQTEA